MFASPKELAALLFSKQTLKNRVFAQKYLIPIHQH